jgi:Na+/melibiose symporter-like transporter
MGTLSGKDKIIYGIGAFGYGSVNQTFGNFLMFFGTGILGLSGTLMGLAVSVATVWDAVTDPIIGSMSDNYSGRFLGKRHSFMFIGCICVAIINIIIWSIDSSWGQSSKFFVLLIALLLVETFNTIYSTPYSALGIDMGRNYDDRTSIQGYKTAFQFLSLLVPSALMAIVLTPKEYVTINTSTKGYETISIITSMLCIITSCVTIFGTKKFRIANTASVKKTNIRKIFQDFFGVLKQKNVGWLILAYSVSLSCGAFITTLGMHIFTYTFHFSSLQVPIIMLCLVAGIILGQPFWYKVSCKIDKKNTVLAALMTVIAASLCFAFILAFRSYIGQYVLVALISVNIFVISCGVGCLYSLPVSMFADCLYKGKEQSIDNTATATGFLTFCTKITNAVVLILVGVILDIIGFESGGSVQTVFVASALGWVLVCGVVIASVVALSLYEKYQYKKDDFM